MFDRDLMYSFLKNRGHIDCHYNKSMASQVLDALRSAGFVCGFENSDQYEFFLGSLRYIFMSSLCGSDEIHMEDNSATDPVMSAEDFLVQFVLPDIIADPEELTTLYEWLPSVV